MIGGSWADPRWPRAGGTRRRRLGRTLLGALAAGFIAATVVTAFPWDMTRSNPTRATVHPPLPLPGMETLPSLPPPVVDRHRELALRTAYAARFEGYWNCLRTPAACDGGYLLPEGEAAQQMAAVQAELRARDRYVGSEPVGYYRIEEIRFLADMRTAEVIACWWSTAVLYGAPVDPDLPVSATNPATLVSSTPEGGRQRDRFVLDEGRWLLASSAAMDEGFAEDPCGR